jgi:asparagine synthase (glutamine-hydrolysing)
VYQLAKQHGVTVILDGQGADEILAGYHKYYHWYWQELVAAGKWKEAKQERDAAMANGLQAGWNWKNIVAAYLPGLTATQLEKKAREQVMNHPFLDHDFMRGNTRINHLRKPVTTKLNDQLYFNTMQLGLEELLRFADRNAMAHSREVRLPFLNHDLVQFIFSLPSSYKIKDGFTKFILRSGMNSFLPNDIVWRKDKIGYEPPQQQWMQQPAIIEKIQEARRTLVGKGVLNKKVLDAPIKAQPAHDAGNYDWRYLSAAACLR